MGPRALQQLAVGVDGRTPDDSARGTSARAWILVIAIAVLGWFLASRSTLFDRDEPRFAQATVEMIASGDWLVPTFDGELRADKPVLVYWLMSVPMRVFGASSWSARFVSPLALACAAWLTYRVGRRLSSERAGLLAMGFLATAPLALLEGTIATTDALLLACVTAATATLVDAALDGTRARHVIALSIALAAAALAKGPVGLALPLLSATTAAWLARGTRTFDRRFAYGVGIATIAAIGAFLAWAIPANAATQGEFARRGLGHHVLERVTTPLESHGGAFFVSLPFYVPVVVFGFLPGLALLPAALSAAWGGRLPAGRSRARIPDEADEHAGRRGRALILAWCVPGFALMTLVSTKLPHYVLPIWPGLALACALVVDAHERDATSARDRAWLARGAWLALAAGGLLVAALAAAPFVSRVPGAHAPAFALAALLGATVACGVTLHRRGRVRAGAWAFVVGSAVAWVVGLTLALPVVERTKVAPGVAAAIRARVPRDVPVARWKFVEPSFDFFLDRPPVRDFETQAEVEAWIAGRGPAVLVLDRRRANELGAQLPPERWVEFASTTGFNLSKGQPLELVALARDVPGLEPGSRATRNDENRAGEVRAAPPR